MRLTVVQLRMKKDHAIKLLGGTVRLAAQQIGISVPAVTKWPDELPDRIADRVIAAVARRRLPELAVEQGRVPAPTATA